MIDPKQEAPRESGERLGEMLLKRGLIDASRLTEALSESKQRREYLGAVLLAKGWINEQDILKVLSEQLRMPLQCLKTLYIDWELVSQFSASLITEHACFPVARNELGVTMAITNPFDAWAMAKAKEETGGRPIEFVLVSKSDMDEVIERYRKQMKARIARLFNDAA